MVGALLEVGEVCVGERVAVVIKEVAWGHGEGGVVVPAWLW